MALVHECLYESPNLATIRMDAYLYSLVSAYHEGGAEGAVAIDYRVEAGEISLTIELAMPLGLIIRELIMNCQKHAFAGRDRGTVTITLERSTGGCG